MYDWCEERLEFQSIADDILAKFVPPHVNIFYCFGGIMLTSFIFQGGSGFALTIYYQPTVVEAFPSVQLILYHVNLGWFIKSIHRWSNSIMLLFQSCSVQFNGHNNQFITSPGPIIGHTVVHP
jgi:cytochrome b6